MSFRSKFLSTFLCLSSFSPLVQADPYFIGQIGMAGLGDNNPYQNIFGDYAKTVLAGRLGLGYLWFVGPNAGLGLEIGATANQSQTYESDYHWAEISHWSADLLAVADFYLSPKFDVFIKAGAAYVSHTLSSESHYYFGYYSSPVSYEYKSTAVAPKLMLGMGYDFTDKINLNFSLSQEFQTSGVYGSTAALFGLRCYFS